MFKSIQQKLSRRGSKLFNRRPRSKLGKTSSVSRAADSANLPESTRTTTTTTMSIPKPQGTVKTRILIISDTHSAPLQPAAEPTNGAGDKNNARAFTSPLPAADVLLHCGDLTMIGRLDEYRACLDMLGSIDAPLKLVIAGNHDISLDGHFYHGMSKGVGMSNGKRMHKYDFDEKMPEQAAELWKGDAAREAGVTYLEEGLHEFELRNGARLKVGLSLVSRLLSTSTKFLQSLCTPFLMPWSYCSLTQSVRSVVERSRDTGWIVGRYRIFER